MLATGRGITLHYLLRMRHARSDAASSVVVAFGITGNLLGLHFMDLLVVFIVAKFITRMGYQFASDALHDLMGRSVDAQTDSLHKIAC